MVESKRNIAARFAQLGELCTPYPGYEFFELLKKLADHPNGLELLKSFQEFCRDLEAATNPMIELVKGRAASRIVLIDALNSAKQQLIIVSPWLSKRSIDDEIILRMTALLEQGCCLHIGWGYSRDIRGLHSAGTIVSVSRHGQCFVDVSADHDGNYSAFPNLDRLQARYPGQIKLKLLGTHEKYVICDRHFAFIGSHNLLSSLDTLLAPREMGWKTTDQNLIEAQIEDFESAQDLKNDPRLWSEFNSSRQSSDLFSHRGDPKLVAEAMKVARQRGINNLPFFKNMKNSEIQSFINQYS